MVNTKALSIRFGYSRFWRVKFVPTNFYENFNHLFFDKTIEDFFSQRVFQIVGFVYGHSIIKYFSNFVRVEVFLHDYRFEEFFKSFIKIKRRNFKKRRYFRKRFLRPFFRRFFYYGTSKIKFNFNKSRKRFRFLSTPGHKKLRDYINRYSRRTSFSYNNGSQRPKIYKRKPVNLFINNNTKKQINKSSSRFGFINKNRSFSTKSINYVRRINSKSSKFGKIKNVFKQFNRFRNTKCLIKNIFNFTKKFKSIIIKFFGKIKSIKKFKIFLFNIFKFFYTFKKIFFSFLKITFFSSIIFSSIKRGYFSSIFNSFNKRIFFYSRYNFFRKVIFSPLCKSFFKKHLRRKVSISLSLNKKYFGFKTKIFFSFFSIKYINSYKYFFIKNIRKKKFILNFTKKKINKIFIKNFIFSPFFKFNIFYFLFPNFSRYNFFSPLTFKNVKSSNKFKRELTLIKFKFIKIKRSDCKNIFRSIKSISKKRRTIIFNFFKNVKLPFLRTFKFNKKFKIILKNGKRKFSLKNKKFSKFFKKKRSSFSHFFKFKGKRKFLRKKKKKFLTFFQRFRRSSYFYSDFFRFKFYKFISSYFSRNFNYKFFGFPVKTFIRIVPAYRTTTRIFLRYFVTKLFYRYLLGDIINPIVRSSIRRFRGFTIITNGRFTRAQIASHRTHKKGSVSFSSVSIPIDYFQIDIPLKYGSCNLKLWIRYLFCILLCLLNVLFKNNLLIVLLNYFQRDEFLELFLKNFILKTHLLLIFLVFTILNLDLFLDLLFWLSGLPSMVLFQISLLNRLEKLFLLFLKKGEIIIIFRYFLFVLFLIYLLQKNLLKLEWVEVKVQSFVDGLLLFILVKFCLKFFL